MSDLIGQRLEKLKKIKQSGVNPFPQPNLTLKQTCLEACVSLGKEVVLAGRIMGIRGHGKILFADLRDQTGKIQLFFQQKVLGDRMDFLTNFDVGDIISVKGMVITTSAGEVTVDVNEYQLLSKNLRPLPEKWHGLTDIEERYRQRYLDLAINPDVQRLFILRAKILTGLRHFLDDHGFLEVETPILQPIYGGASARPFVTHHQALDQDMYLRISDELYLKRLIVGGFEKVYEVSRDFRNEGMSRFHNPEFTQVEFYWAYADYDVLMSFTEELIAHLVNLTNGSSTVTYQGHDLSFAAPFPRLTFRDAILEHTSVDIDSLKSVKEFLSDIKSKNIKLDLNGVYGLGAHFDALYKEHVRPKLIGPLFLTDYPAEMIALAKRKENDPSKIASFQLLACGTELLKAYNELNDPVDQYERWQEEEKLEGEGAQNAMVLDRDYIRALEYGMPPTAGWGMGIDRLTQFLTDSPTIKDVILFPTLRNEPDSQIELTVEQLTAPTKKTSATASQDIGFANPLVVIGQVTGIDSIENSDKLKLYHVKTSPTDILNITSSCDNVKVGDIVPVALPNALVFAPNGKTQKIKPTTLRGIMSEAMMCSPLEIGVSDNHTSIFLLPPDLSQFLGQPLALHFKI
ncbi:MAG: lysine--tRNA ligase [Candidatus Shapirobacteria bacterium]